MNLRMVILVSSSKINGIIHYTFTDVLVKGTFHSFTHTHIFIESSTGTIMTDIFDYKAPFGIIGHVANIVFLEKYMRKFIGSRANELKKMAELKK
jgi:ligand-binding SRPBCC domain-containing protein